MAKHIFENTPFYQWFRRCSECGKRSIWTPMAWCAACETYNHRRCNESHAMRMESTDDSLLATQDDFVVIDLDEMAPFGCTEQPRPGHDFNTTEWKHLLVRDQMPYVPAQYQRQSASYTLMDRLRRIRCIFRGIFFCPSPSSVRLLEDTANTTGERIQMLSFYSSGEGAMKLQDEAAAGKGPDSAVRLQKILRASTTGDVLHGTTADQRNSATAQVDNESAVAADEKGETFVPQENPSPSPEQPRAEGNCCWLIAQYPKTFWPNHRHFLHSSDCLVFPFPKPTGTVVPEDGGDHLQTWPWSFEEDVVEKISAETMTTVNLQSFL